MKGSLALVIYDPCTPSWQGEVVVVISEPERDDYEGFVNGKMVQLWNVVMVEIALGERTSWVPPEWLLPLPPDDVAKTNERSLEAANV